jgi:hypothetical protein
MPDFLLYGSQLGHDFQNLGSRSGPDENATRAPKEEVSRAERESRHAEPEAQLQPLIHDETP